MTPEQVSEIADRLGVQENEVEMMDGRMSTGDQSLNAPMRAAAQKAKMAASGRTGWKTAPTARKPCWQKKTSWTRAGNC